MGYIQHRTCCQGEANTAGSGGCDSKEGYEMSVCDHLTKDQFFISLMASE